jgi:hypothetical protein
MRTFSDVFSIDSHASHIRLRQVGQRRIRDLSGVVNVRWQFRHATTCGFGALRGCGFFSEGNDLIRASMRIGYR